MRTMKYSAIAQFVKRTGASGFYYILFVGDERRPLYKAVLRLDTDKEPNVRLGTYEDGAVFKPVNARDGDCSWKVIGKAARMNPHIGKDILYTEYGAKKLFEQVDALVEANNIVTSGKKVKRHVKSQTEDKLAYMMEQILSSR